MKNKYCSSWLSQQYDPAVGELAAETADKDREKSWAYLPKRKYRSPAVMAAMGSAYYTNKYAEGYRATALLRQRLPVRSDIVEEIARRELAIFRRRTRKCSTTFSAQANTAVYFAMLNQTIQLWVWTLMRGGHLTRGSPVNISGKYFNIPYGVDSVTHKIDYDKGSWSYTECKQNLL